MQAQIFPMMAKVLVPILKVFKIARSGGRAVRATRFKSVDPGFDPRVRQVVASAQKWYQRQDQSLARLHVLSSRVYGR